VPEIILEQPVPREFQPEIVKNLYWLDGGIESFAFDATDGRRLSFGYRKAAVPEHLPLRVKQSAERLARSLRAIPSKTLFELKPANAGCAAPYDQLVQRGWVRPAAHGTHVYRGLFLDLFLALDAQFRQAALRLEAEEYKFPAIIPMETLARAGYLNSFPHNANFVCHLPEQAEAVERFKDRMKSSSPEGATLSLDGFCTHSATALSPTVCYHFYQTHAGQTLPADALLTATALSPCYRYEGKAMRGLRRLREFTMREIIFLGEPTLVQKRREALISLQRELLERCQLHSAIRTASDPFFLDDYDKKRVFQMSFDLKHEVQAWLPEEQEWLAIGSVNHHQDHFGKVFGITLPEGMPAQSCCLGFGLDRWCMTIFAQHGFDPNCWPEGVRVILDAHRRHTAALKTAA